MWRKIWSFLRENLVQFAQFFSKNLGKPFFKFSAKTNKYSISCKKNFKFTSISLPQHGKRKSVKFSFQWNFSSTEQYLSKYYGHYFFAKDDVYQHLTKKKHHGKVRKVQSEFIAVGIESTDLTLSCIFLYPNISFWHITCHDSFSGWDL